MPNLHFLRRSAVAILGLVISSGAGWADTSFSYNFDDFSNGSTPPGMNLVGNAVITDDPGGGFFDQRLRLTFSAGGQVGSAWRTSLSDVVGGFDTTFRFQTSFHGGGGADGISFNIQSLGDSLLTGHLGPGAGSLSVAFDTYQNGGDPSDNFVRIYSGGSDIAVRNLYSDGINMKDSNTHTARIVYAPGDLDVYVDGIAVLSNVNVDLGTAGALVGGNAAYVGFGAATGGSTENHDIKEWAFTGLDALDALLSIADMEIDLDLNESLVLDASGSDLRGRTASEYLFDVAGTVFNNGTNPVLTLTEAQLRAIPGMSAINGPFPVPPGLSYSVGLTINTTDGFSSSDGGSFTVVPEAHSATMVALLVVSAVGVGCVRRRSVGR